METTLTRSIAGVAVVAVVAAGWYVGTGLTAAIETQVETVLARQVDPALAQRQAMNRKANYEDTSAFYEARVDAVVEERGLSKPDLATLHAVHAFEHAITEAAPVVVPVGESTVAGPLTIAIVSERLIVDNRRGIRTKHDHTLARVTNNASNPVAYRLTMRQEGGAACQVKTLLPHNALVLAPGETAEIAACDGKQSIELADVRTLEVTEVGAAWIDKIPPLVLGHDNETNRAHLVPQNVRQCPLTTRVYVDGLAAGDFAWEDIVDFYARHDCDNFEWWPGYRRQTEPVESLPILAPPDIDP